MATTTDHTERAEKLRERWSKDESFTARIATRKIAADPTATALVRDMRFLLDSFPDRFERIVEVGCGDGQFARILERNFPELTLVATDIEGERIEKAKADYPDLDVRTMDLRQSLDAFLDSRTIFMAMNVLGNIVPEEIEETLKRIANEKAALVFSAATMPVHMDYKWFGKGLAYLYNYHYYAKTCGLQFISYRSNFRENKWQKAGIVGVLLASEDAKSIQEIGFKGERIDKAPTRRKES